MQITVKLEEPSKVSRKLTITVPADTVSTWMQRKLVEVQKTARLKGFREGHVPMSVVKKFYFEDVRQRVLTGLIDESFHHAVHEKKLRPVSRPAIETVDKATHPIQEGKDFTFIATVEIFPELEVKSYTGLKLNRPKIDVTDDDVEKVVEGIRQQHAQLVPIQKERKTKKGDFVDFSFKGGVVTDSGVKELEGMSGQRVMEIGSGELIPGFEDEMIGLNKGEDKTFRIKFPEEYSSEDLAGKESEFAITIHEIKEKQLPEMTDEFAKDAGYESVADFKAKAKTNLLRYRTEEADRETKNELLKVLIDKNPFDVPQTLIRAQTNLLSQEFAQTLKQQRFNDKMIQEVISSEQENLAKRAESQVRSGLILDWIATKESIKVSDADVETEIKQMATSMQIDEKQIRDFYSGNVDKMDNLKFRIKEEKTIKFLLDQAKIK
jgi:trigger factor